MRVWRIAILLQASACSLYFGDPASETPTDPATPTPVYELTPVRSIAGELPVAGIDSDGAGGLWIAYDQQIGDLGDPADIRVVHLGSDGRKLSEWRYPDEYSFVAGIAFAGDTLWLGYDPSRSAMSSAVRVIDAKTGTERGRFLTDPGFVDLAYRDGELLISNVFNVVIAVDPSTGGEHWRVQGPPFTQSTQTGIAASGAGVWLSTWMDGAEAPLKGRFALVDREGTTLAIGHAAVFDAQTSAALTDGMQLAWDGTHLIVHWRSQIKWFDVHR